MPAWVAYLDVALNAQGPLELVEDLSRLLQCSFLICLSLRCCLLDIAKSIFLLILVVLKFLRYVLLLLAQVLDVAVLLIAQFTQHSDLVVITAPFLEQILDLAGPAGHRSPDLVSLLSPVATDGVVAAFHERGVIGCLVDAALRLRPDLLHLGAPCP